jgi:hypothetical protein
VTDFDNLVPLIAGRFGLAPSTLLLLVAGVHLAAKFGSRRIPNDATGFWGFVRQTCVIFGVDPSSRVTADVTVQDVAAKALATPPITQKVAADKGIAPADVLPGSPS